MSIRRVVGKSIWPIVGVSLIALAAYNYSRMGRQENVVLRCSGRNACAASSQLARRIVAEVGTEGIQLELVAADNSHAIGTAIDHHLLDLGVMLGGFPPGEFENVRQVASLGVEPLHLLVRGELVEDGDPTIEALRDCRVYVGELDSNTSELAEDLLRYAGFAAKDAAGEGDYEALYLPERELREQVRDAHHAPHGEREERWAGLPDALFVGGSLPDPLVDVLVRSAGYRLVPLPFATALHLDERRDYGPDKNPLKNSRIESAIIPAYTYGASPAAPPQPCGTIGLRLLLVAHKDVPAATIHRLLRALNEGSFREFHPELNVAAPIVEFPLHAGATSYTASRRPLSLNDVVQNAANAFSMVGAFSAGAFALWSYFRGLRRISPQCYLEQIDRIERLVRGVESEDAAPSAPTDLLTYLEARLAEIKQAVVEDFARGRLVGDDALLGILTMLADTRHLLAETSQRLCRTHPAAGREDYRQAA